MAGLSHPVHPPAGRPARLPAGAPALLALLLLAALAGCQYLPGHKAAVKAAAPVRIVKLDSTVLNLADTSGPAYLRLGVSLGIASLPPKDSDLKTKTIARDTIVTLASKETSDVLLSASGKEDLKRALLAELRRRLPDAQIEKLYFDEFLVQR
ncbi:MAG TPA: flagellar basal body-associated FliL family protein [Terriglobales bacterium]|nr:flagellar basal body-associated FliL family protein [Terriglobales bacterium]